MGQSRDSVPHLMRWLGSVVSVCLCVGCADGGDRERAPVAKQSGVFDFGHSGWITKRATYVLSWGDAEEARLWVEAVAPRPLPARDTGAVHVAYTSWTFKWGLDSANRMLKFQPVQQADPQTPLDDLGMWEARPIFWSLAAGGGREMYDLDLTVRRLRDGTLVVRAGLSRDVDVDALSGPHLFGGRVPQLPNMRLDLRNAEGEQVEQKVDMRALAAEATIETRPRRPATAPAKDGPAT
jgi:hypothetical protein